MNIYREVPSYCKESVRPTTKDCERIFLVLFEILCSLDNDILKMFLGMRYVEKNNCDDGIDFSGLRFITYIA